MGIFARCILAPKGCRGGQKKYNVNIKKWGKEGKVRVLCIHAFMHPHHIIPFFYHQNIFWKVRKGKQGPTRAGFQLGLTLRIFQKAFMLCLSMLKSICRCFFGCRPSPRDWSNLFKKKLYLQKVYVFGIGALYVVMVAESFGCRSSPRDWSRSFLKRIQLCKKYMFLGSGPFTW